MGDNRGARLFLVSLSRQALPELLRHFGEFGICIKTVYNVTVSFLRDYPVSLTFVLISQAILTLDMPMSSIEALCAS